MKTLLQELNEKYGERELLYCEIDGFIMNTRASQSANQIRREKPELVKILEGHGFDPCQEDTPFSFRVYCVDYGIHGADTWTTLYVIREALVALLTNTEDKAKEIMEKAKEGHTFNRIRFNDCVGRSMGLKSYVL
jgi:hypothetical protein